MAAEGQFSVNWKNPMLLGAEHLRLADRLSDEARRWLARGLAHPAGHYGLLAPRSSTGKGLEFTFDQNAGRLSVSLQILTALAPDGTALIWDEDAYPELQRHVAADIDLEPLVPEPIRLAVCVRPRDPSGHGPEAEVAVGQPDPDEEPARKPLRTPALALDIGRSLHSSDSRLKIAEFTWDGAHLTLDEDMIPASLTTAAWPRLFRRASEIRAEIQRLREIMRQAAADVSETAQEALLRPVLLPLLAAVAAIEDELPERDPRLHPYDLVLTVKKVLRTVRVMIGSQPAALDHAITNLVQPGKLSSGDPHFFENVTEYLRSPYDHDDLGRQLTMAVRLLDGTCEVVAHLLGARADAPVVEEVDPAVYKYHDKTYRLAVGTGREFQINEPEPWHVCHFREMSVDAPRSLLLVCDKALLFANPRANAGLWMLDRYEKIIAKMFRVSVDNTSDPKKVVALYTHIGEPTVTAVSVATSGLLDFSGLGSENDERLRIYYEAT